MLERAEGVTAVPGTDFGGAANTLRLAYSFVSPDEIETGVERLAAASAQPTLDATSPAAAVARTTPRPADSAAAAAARAPPGGPEGGAGLLERERAEPVAAEVAVLAGGLVAWS